MRQFNKLFILILFGFLLISCVKDSSYDLYLEGSSNSYYNWTYTIEDSSVLNVVNENYYGKENNDEIKGLDGEYYFEIKPLKEGKTKINFKYMRSWEEDDILYDYVVEFKVNHDLEIEKISESGNYLSLVKFLNYDIDKLGLENNFSDYKLIFESDVITVDNKECDFLTVYDYNDEIVNVYGISKSDDSVYMLIDGKMVIVE